MKNKILNFIALNMRKIILVVAVLALIFPFLFSNVYIIRMGTISLMYVMLALGINLIMGYMGQMTFGHAAFWGIGAYTAAIMSTKLGTPFIVDIICAALIAGTFGFLLGLPVLKVKGYYLTIVTLGFGEIIRLVELNSTKLTGGAMGIKGIPGIKLFGKEFDSHLVFYYLILILAVITIIILLRINKSRYGLALKSIRDDDSAAEVLGVDVVKTKIKTFVISAMIAGVAGAFFAHYITYIDSTSFTTSVSQEMTVMVIIGGIGSIPGTIIGATVLTIVPELIRQLMEYRMLLYGLIMLLMTLFRPHGLLGSVNFSQIKSQLIESGHKVGRFEK